MTFDLTRRNALAGLFLLAAPAIIHTPGLLMPVRDRLADADDIREWLLRDTLKKRDAAVREIERIRSAGGPSKRVADASVGTAELRGMRELSLKGSLPVPYPKLSTFV